MFGDDRPWEYTLLEETRTHDGAGVGWGADWPEREFLSVDQALLVPFQESASGLGA